MKSRPLSGAGIVMLASGIVICATALAVPHVQAQAFSVIHNFTGGNDGSGPLNGFTTDSAGNLYGTTESGGTSNYGVVFKMDTSGTETVLHNFAGAADGTNPSGVLIRDKAGNLYGTTTAGGLSGAGTVFKVSAAGGETVLYGFTGVPDGADPEAGLVMDASGNLYGTTAGGGANGNGTVFKLSPANNGTWAEKVLYSFGSGTDGAVPVGGVTISAGSLYGATSSGGLYGLGTIFKLTPSGAGVKETIVHNFENGDDGATPYGGLIAGKAGALYGSATEGGAGGGGTIFELIPANGNLTFIVLYSNPGWGISGSFRDLALDASGNIYGTTHCDGAYDSGTAYKLTPASGSWTYTSLHVFTGGSDGLYVFSNLVGIKGKLYGTTNLGGAHGLGVVFEVAP